MKKIKVLNSKAVDMKVKEASNTFACEQSKCEGSWVNGCAAPEAQWINATC
jgi:hypothetical protein